MKKIKYIWIIVMMGMIGSSCTNELEKEKDGKINLQTKVQGVQKISRTPQLGEDGSGVFTEGDQIKLLVFRKSEQMSAFDYTIGETQLYWREVGVGESDGNVIFSACYPPQEIVDGTFVFDLNQAPYKDLLWARTENVVVGTEKPVMMNFQHALSKLVVKYTIESSFASIQEKEIRTSCSAVSGCTVNLREKTLDRSSFSNTVFTAQGGEVEFLLVPQETAEIGLTVAAGELSYQTSLDSLIGKNVALESGKKMTLNLTLKEGRLELEGFTIEGWGDQGSFDQDIIM